MDEITHDALMHLARQHPGAAIRLARQFLDPRPCGFVPQGWQGDVVAIDNRLRHEHMAGNSDNLH